MRARAAAWTAAWAVGAIAPSALAEPSPADRALATELFKQGRERMKKGEVPEACRDFAESQRLDPGGGTLLNLALCHEQEGKTATAWSELHEALSLAERDGRPERADLARARIASLEPRLVRLRVVVKGAARGLAVSRDGSLLPEAAWGVSAPVDPGEHLVEAKAPARRSFRALVDARAPGSLVEVTVPELSPEPLPEAPPQASAAPPASAAAPRPPPMPTASAAPGASETNGGRRVWRTSTIAAAGVGAAGLALGAFFGLRALSRDRASDALCTPRCTQEGLSLNHQAGAAADASTVSFAVGLAALGALTYLIVSPPPSPSQARWDGAVHF